MTIDRYNYEPSYSLISRRDKLEKASGMLSEVIDVVRRDKDIKNDNFVETLVIMQIDLHRIWEEKEDLISRTRAYEEKIRIEHKLACERERQHDKRHNINGGGEKNESDSETY